MITIDEEELKKAMGDSLCDIGTLRRQVVFGGRIF
jgi:hypothetical protein